MKILILNQFCSPEPDFKSVPFARELIRRGHEVRILTSFPNYPGGKLYPGYRLRLCQRETLEGVPILRVPLYPSHDRSGLRRVLTYASFGAAVLPPLLGGWRPDLIYAYNLITKGLAAALAGWVRQIPFVLDIQDLWPDAVFNSGMGRAWMLKPIHALCGCVYSRAAAITVLSPGFKRALIQRSVPAAKIEVIYNWCNEAGLPQSNPDLATLSEGALAGRFNILFAGSMSRAQGLGAVIEAARLVAGSHPNIQFVFMGAGRLTAELKVKAESVAPRNTLFLPYRPSHEAAGIMEQAQVLLVHLRKHPLYEITIPSKTQGALAMGKPILIGVGGDAGQLVASAGAGVACNPEDAESLAAAAIRLAEMPADQLREMGLRGREYYQRELCLRAGTNRFEALFQRIMERTAVPGN